MTPKFLATLDGEGRPNCVPVISIAPWDDTTLVFGEFFMNKSRKNLAVNENVGVVVLNDRLDAWSLKGTFRGFETTGPHIDWINQQPLFRYNAYTSVRSAGTIAIEEISKKSTLSPTALLAGYACARCAARAFGRSASPIMPPRVLEKFRRLRAVRAIAFRDADGFPRAVAVMACVAAGPSRLLARGPMLDAYRAGLSVGTGVAVAIITMDPVAYQVKGVYQGRRAGCHMIDLEECYSASPPLLGERLDGVQP